jgi:hypothetical protein
MIKRMTPHERCNGKTWHFPCCKEGAPRRVPCLLIMAQDRQGQSFNQLSREELLSHLEVLQRQFVDVSSQRDELSRDVELFSSQSMNATFDKSSFLLERVRNAETELARLKDRYVIVSVELNDVKEDQVHLKEAKRVSDRSAREVCYN